VTATTSAALSERLKLLVLLNFPEHVRRQYTDGLASAFPELDVVEADHHTRAEPQVRDADILVTFGAHISDAVLEQGEHLRWIQALGTGVDGIVDRPGLRPGVLVTSLHGLQSDSVAESVLCSMLALARDLPRSLRNQAASRWQRFEVGLLKGKTAGILGVGSIAIDLAPRLAALGMRVVGITETPRELAGFAAMRRRSELTAAVADLDYLVLLLPYRADTRGIVSAQVLSAMKPAAFVVNVARGGIVDEQALIDALRAGTIAGAALDVFVEEPLPPEHPFWGMENAIITPHMAGFHSGYAAVALPVVIDNVRHFLAGEIDRMTNVVRR
jgi:phosphoglycerate dehydrogenase-like enzyme